MPNGRNNENILCAYFNRNKFFSYCFFLLLFLPAFETYSDYELGVAEMVREGRKCWLFGAILCKRNFTSEKGFGR